MFERFNDLIAYTKRTQNLTTAQIGEICGVCRATAFRWASGQVEPSWYPAARTLLTRPLITLIEAWAEHSGDDAGELEVYFALDGSRVTIVYADVVVGRGETFAAAIEDAMPQ